MCRPSRHVLSAHCCILSNTLFTPNLLLWNFVFKKITILIKITLVLFIFLTSQPIVWWGNSSSTSCPSWSLLAVVKILSWAGIGCMSDTFWGSRSESCHLMIFAALRNRSASSQNGVLTMSESGKLLSKSCSGELNAGIRKHCQTS